MNRLIFALFSSLVTVCALAGCAPSSPSVPSNHSSGKQTNHATGQTQENTSGGSNKSDVTNSSAPAGGGNSTTANQTTNHSGGTGTPQTNGLQFADYIVTAMNAVKQGTKMPALFAPTEPTFQPNAQFVGVKAYASDWDYSISLFSTSAAVPLNDASLDQLPASAAIGTFGATYYSSNAKAQSDFNTEFSVKKIQSAGTVNGFMKQYRTGKEYDMGSPSNYQLPQDVIEWQEGDWTIDVFGAPSLDLNNTAKQLDDFLKTNALPPTEGHILVDPNLTGNPVTQIGWVFGNTFYVCDASSMMNALQMAVSMREYDSYKVTP